MTQAKLLRKILSEVQETTLQNGKTLAVFDLDSTLFDVSPRIQQILWDFAHHPEYSKRYPETVDILKNIQTQRRDWGIKHAILRAGLGDHAAEFHEDLRLFWKQHFFSNAYLEYDKPFEGAVEFTQEIWRKGADVVYLTGRDVLRMGEGSESVLKKWNFPIQQERTTLVLKPKAGMDDAQFKKDWFAAQSLREYEHIWFFENEPVNLLEIQKYLPEVKMIFFDSTHSGVAAPLPDVPTILHFLLEDT